MTFFQHCQEKRGFRVLTRTSSWTCVIFTDGLVATDVAQEAMRKFLESRGVLAGKDYYPDGAAEQLVKAYEEHSLLGPDPNAPRICLNQTFKGKWNREVVDILTAAFISAVKQGVYKPVLHSWPQMKEDEVRKRCQNKLYRTQYICRKHRKNPISDKMNRMYQRRQEVCLLVGLSRYPSTIFRRHTTEGGRSTTSTAIMTQRHGRALGFYLMLLVLGVLATTRPTMKRCRSLTHALRPSGVLIQVS
jgi:hypothetical protein